MCPCISQPRWIPAKRPMGSLDITPLLTSMELSSRQGLLDFENEKYVVSYVGRAQPPLSIVQLFSSWSIGPQGMNSSCSSWGAYLSPDSIVSYCLFLGDRTKTEE